MTPAASELLRLIRALEELTTRILPQVEEDPVELHVLLARASTVVTRVCELAASDDLRGAAHIRQRILTIQDRIDLAIDRAGHVRAEILQATKQLNAARNMVHRLQPQHEQTRLLGAA